MTLSSRPEGVPISGAVCTPFLTWTSLMDGPLGTMTSAIQTKGALLNSNKRREFAAVQLHNTKLNWSANDIGGLCRFINIYSPLIQLWALSYPPTGKKYISQFHWQRFNQKSLWILWIPIENGISQFRIPIVHIWGRSLWEIPSYLHYRVTLVVSYLGWVDLDFDVPLSARFC